MKRTLVTMVLIGGVLLLMAFSELLVAPGLNQPTPIAAYLNGNFPEKLTEDWVWTTQYASTGMLNVITARRIPSTNKMAFGSFEGKIYTFDFDAINPNPVLIGDIAPAGGFLNSRYGLKGLAFHPEFGQAGSPNRGYIYISWMTTATKSRLSRFTIPDGALSIDLSSELVMIDLLVPGGSFHSVGEIDFGLDGFLYVPFGDGHGGGFGPYAGTPISDTIMNVVQRIDHNLRGGIMRIDVDEDATKSHAPRKVLPQAFPEEISGVGYGIPNDNPWLATDGSLMEEYYSLGHRNPWKLSIDPLTGIPWVGEVGPHNGEELNRIQKGHNYGWPYRVGPTGEIVWDRTPPSAPEPDPFIGPLTNPVFSSSRADGRSMMVGCIYRGSVFPELEGKIIAGDVATRNMWIVTYNESNQQGAVEKLPNQPSKAYAVFEDPSGEILMVRTNGTISKLQKATGSPPPPPPALLSQTGAFTNLSNLTPAPGIIPYTVNSPLWSDGATKQRWIALPNDGTHDSAEEQISFQAEAPWTFPEGTVFIKHFELPLDPANPTITTRLETRFIVIGEDENYYGLTYRWNAGQTDAVLLMDTETRDISVLDGEGNSVIQTWTFPGRNDCLSCHSLNAGKVLGVNTHQLNGDQYYPSTTLTANQLETWDHLSMFAQPLDSPENYLRSVALDDAMATPTQKIFSYLDANCRHCHIPGGVTASFDARLAVPYAAHNLIDEPTISPTSPGGNVVVLPGIPNQSELFTRDDDLGPAAMPPLAKSIVDTSYINQLKTWIQELEADVLTFDAVGEVGQISTDENWKLVTLERIYADPVVITGALSQNGNIPAFARIRNVTTNSFEVRVESWCGNEDLGAEQISYLVVEAGDYQLPNGKRMMAGKIDNVTHQWTNVSYARSFTAPPVLLSASQTHNEAAATVRMRNLDGAGFEVRMQESEGADGNHTAEQMGWIAFEVGFQQSGLAYEAGIATNIDEIKKRVSFQQHYAYKPICIGVIASFAGSDPIAPRFNGLTMTGYGVEVLGEEETCGDAEVAHFEEDFNFMIFERPGLLLAHDLSQIKLQLKVFLQGPFSNGTMSTQLNTLIPLTDPYGLNETVASIPTDVVDWVKVELRDPNNQNNILANRACFLRNDGQIIEADGTIGVRFERQSLTQALVMVTHRNHLGVMTSNAINLAPVQ